MVGIDLGQSLTKIAFIEDSNNLTLNTLSTHSDKKIIELFLESKKKFFNKYNFTGGQGFSYQKKFMNEIDTNLLSEFQAQIKGLEPIYVLNKKKKFPNSLVLNIGTGSFLLLKKTSFEHLGGSALGGGFFMGFIKLLYDIDDYQEAIKLAVKGDRYNIDLKVSDVYEADDQRVSSIFREFTAATFGKISKRTNSKSIKKEDVINSLICLIGENLGTIANLMAKNHEIDNIVFCGGFLKDNKILKRILSTICAINKNKAEFLKYSEFCGAVGALIS